MALLNTGLVTLMISGPMGQHLSAPAPILSNFKWNTKVTFSLSSLLILPCSVVKLINSPFLELLAEATIDKQCVLALPLANPKLNEVTALSHEDGVQHTSWTPDWANIQQAVSMMWIQCRKSHERWKNQDELWVVTEVVNRNQSTSWRLFLGAHLYFVGLRHLSSLLNLSEMKELHYTQTITENG